MRTSRVSVLCAITIVAIASSQAFASFHFMQIEQVIAGVNGNTNAQAIQLRMRIGFQNQMQFAKLVARDAAGANPVTLATFAGPVANTPAGSRVLIASSGFAAQVAAPITPDAIMTNLIPASYLTAGSLTFESTTNVVYWRLSWGGAAYTGPTTGDLTNDADGNFGKLTTALQSTTLQAHQFTGSVTAASTVNSSDYIVTAGAATFTNNAGASATVVACQPVTVNPATLPAGTLGVFYSQNLSAVGSVGPYSFAVTAGALPDGLTLTSGGLLSGTPTTVDVAAFTVTATASTACTGNRAYNLTIDCPPVNIAPVSLPNGSVGSPYNQQLTASGGTAPHTFVVQTGSLPGNVSLSPAGLLSGTPDGPGLFNFTVLASSNESCTGDRAYAITVTSGANGDLDAIGGANGIDIQLFVNCVLNGTTAGGTCPPGDFNGDTTVNAADVPGFVAALTGP